jgi:thioesterase domain-containing protein/malonyl CoA-acyl carrier protein transacylase/acyl carrier protein
LAAAELFRSWGIMPVAMLGHSMGEYAAAFLAGVFTLPDVLSVVACRGRLFETLPDGAMLSVPLPEAEVLPELLPGLSFAASNGPGLSLVSGEVAAIAALEARLAARGVEARRLSITVAAHSQMLDPILGAFDAYLRTLRLSEPTLPFVSNVTGTWILPHEARDPGYWVKHLRQPVRFAEGLSTLVSESGHALLEVGPGRTLTSLAQAHPAIASARCVVQSLRHPQDPTTDREAVMAAVGRLWAAGVEPNWKRFFGTGRRRVSLPTYSFDHERHWIEPGNGFFLRADTSHALEKNEDRSQWTYRQGWRISDPPDARQPAGRNILVFEDELGVGRELVLELRAAGHTVDVAKRGESFARVDDSTFQLRPGSRDDHGALLQALSGVDHTPAQIVHLWAVGDERPGADRHAGDEYLLPLVCLAQALIDEEPSGPVEVVVVTNGADAAGTDSAPRFPLKALTQGPVRVIPREMPSVACRSVDLTGILGSTQVAARTLVAEVDAQTTDTHVALRGDDRFVEAYERWPLVETSGPWPLREHGVVLITGGLGGLALALGERLARTAHARLVLVGRSALPPREEWPDLVSRLDASDSTLAKIRGVQAIETAGGQVLIAAVDASDPVAMRRVVADAEARFGAINAAIHAAGIIDDGPLHSKERHGLDAVLRPKVSGAVALVEALRGRTLDFLALFSSSSAALGPAGQIDYVAANAFLNAYAHQLAAEGLPVRAVQWGAWREVGMAVAALAPSPLAGTEKVEHPLLQRRSEGENGSILFRATLDVRSQWVLDEHRVRGAEPVLPGTGFVEMARAALMASGVASERSALELTDLAFTSPLVVPEKAPCVVETEVRREADGSIGLAVRSLARRGPAVEHATGRGRVLADWNPPRIDVAAIEARCTLRHESFEPGQQLLPQERLLAFGARWKAVRTIALGRDEAVTHLELLEAHASDLDLYALHPALLDMATGSAFSLIDGAGADSGLIVPLSYGRIRIAGRLPRRLVSHVRLRPGSGEGVGVLDATLADEHGRVVVEIEAYVVKNVDPRVLKGIRKMDGSTSPLERWVEQGILPDEGFDLLGRVLAQDQEVQVLVSPLDLHSMIAELRAPERSAAPASVVSSPSASSGETAQNAPRDEIEQRLAGLWGELLGVERIGLQDGFFDLGGHSLIAVRLFARIRKMWGVDLPLATLFTAPTLEALAAEVRTRLGLTLDVPGAPASVSPAPATRAWSPLVLIRKGGSRRPFFCVHGAGGNLLNFRDFSERLSPEQPVYGLEARGVDGQLPPAGSIGEMADLYLTAIRAQQAHGPYLLGGYSGGGVVALEIARKLAEAGERTNEIVLLDTFHPSTSARAVTWRDHFEGVVKEGLPYLRRHVNATVERHFVWARQDRRLRSHLKRNEAVPHELREWHLATSFLDALRRHTPAPYSGRVTLFRAQEVARAYDHLGERIGWDENVLPNLELFEVPGGHDSLVREPNVRVLVAGLDKVLSRGSRDISPSGTTETADTRDRQVTVGA